MNSFNHNDTSSWFFNDSQGRWHGPFETTVMLTWFRAGYFAPSVVLRASLGTELRAASEIAVFAAAFRSDSGEGDNYDNNNTAAAAAAIQSTASTAPDATDESQWCYKDPNGQEQGPFTTSQMGMWISSGFFNRSQLVRCDDEDGFRTMANVFEFSSFFNSNAGNAAGQAGAYVVAAQFDGKGHFKKNGVLNAHASQGLRASDGEYNQLVRSFDVEGYQEEMRKKKARLADPNQSLRANQTRYEKSKQSQKQDSKR